MENSTYNLTAEERGLLLQVQARVLNAKGRIHDLNVELEKAQGELRDAHNGHMGALAMLLQQRGWKSGELSADLVTLTNKE